MRYFPKTLKGVLRVLCELRRWLWFFAPILAVDNLAPFVWGALYLCRHDDQPTPLFCRLLPCLCVAHNMSTYNYTEVRFTRSARKHRIGRGSADHVIRLNSPTVIQTEPLKLLWIGVDGRNRELEIIAVLENQELIIIHAMPTIYRRGKRNG
jgi:hypothetical protein